MGPKGSGGPLPGFRVWVCRVWGFSSECWSLGLWGLGSLGSEKLAKTLKLAKVGQAHDWPKSVWPKSAMTYCLASTPPFLAVLVLWLLLAWTPLDHPAPDPPTHPLRRTAQNFALVFFSSPAPFRSFFPLLGVFSLNFGGVFEGRKCGHVGSRVVV